MPFIRRQPAWLAEADGRSRSISSKWTGFGGSGADERGRRRSEMAGLVFWCSEKEEEDDEEARLHISEGRSSCQGSREANAV